MKIAKREVWKLHLDVDDFLFRSTDGMSVEQVGQLARDMAAACVRIDLKYLESLPFVRRIYCRAIGGREHIPTRIQRLVLAAGVCALCGSSDCLTIDHIRPWVLGGSNSIRNLQCLCQTCNRKKGPQAWTARKAKARNG